MIMEEKCPYCDSESIAYDDCEDEQFGDSIIRIYGCRCDKGHEFIISEEFVLKSRIVARDDDELDRLIEEEEKEAKE